MFAQIRCKFRNEELIAGNCKGDASRDKPGAEVGCESFGRIHDYSFEFRLRQIDVLPDFCRRIVISPPPKHEEQRRLTDPSLEELVKVRQKHRQRPIPVPFLQQDGALKNGSEIAFEPVAVRISVRRGMSVF